MMVNQLVFQKEDTYLNKIYATLIVSEHFEAIKIDAKNNKYALEILSTLPETINTDELKRKSLLLTALTVVEPLLRCGEDVRFRANYWNKTLANSQNTTQRSV